MAEGYEPKPTCEAKVVFEETDQTYNMTTTVIANNHCVNVSVLRESGNQTSSGWTYFAAIPQGYSPKKTITAYFISEYGSVIRFRVASNGGTAIYSIPNGQIGCSISYPI